MPGPKKRPKELNRSEYMVIRLSEQEKKFIIELAKDQKTSAGALVRDVIFNPAVREGVKSKFKNYAAAAEVAKILESEEAKNDDTD